MRSGRLRHSVVVQRHVTTKTDTGNLVDTWNDIATRPAAIEPLMGKEFYANSAEHSRMNTRIRMRHEALLATLKPFDRIVDRRRSPEVVYDIESVQNHLEKDREFVLMCKRNG